MKFYGKAEAGEKAGVGMKRKIKNAAIRPMEGIGKNDLPLGEQTFFQGWQPTTKATEKDEVESYRVGRAIRAAVKQCWFNARKAVLKLTEYAEASYIEGWVVYLDNGLITEHKWIVRNGKVIDPTVPSEEIANFPGLEFQGRKGIEEFLLTPLGKKHRKEPFFFAFGWGGHKNPGYMKAFQDAKAFENQLILERKKLLSGEKNKSSYSKYIGGTNGQTIST